MHYRGLPANSQSPWKLARYLGLLAPLQPGLPQLLRPPSKPRATALCASPVACLGLGLLETFQQLLTSLLSSEFCESLTFSFLYEVTNHILLGPSSSPQSTQKSLYLNLVNFAFAQWYSAQRMGLGLC